jgi:hypothetical protein
VSYSFFLASLTKSQKGKKIKLSVSLLRAPSTNAPKKSVCIGDPVLPFRKVILPSAKKGEERSSMIIRIIIKVIF